MDIVVTVPKWFWPEWIDEGDAAGDPQSGEEWGYSTGAKPNVGPGDLCYIVSHGRLRGYAPITRVVFENGKWYICRQGGAVAVTINEYIPGFRGFRKRWWERQFEVPFPDWKTAGVTP